MQTDAYASFRAESGFMFILKEFSFNKEEYSSL